MNTSALRSKKILPWIVFLYVISLATSMSGMEFFGTVLIIFFIFTFEKKSFLEVPFIKPILVFVLLSWVSTLLGDAKLSDKIYDLSRMRFFLFYISTYWALRQTQIKPQLLRVLLITTLVVGIYGFIQHFHPIDLIRPEGKKVLMYAISDQKIGPLVVGTFNHHLTFSNIYLFYACLFFSLGVFTGSKVKLFLGLFIYLLCVWTQSRVAWFAAPLTIVGIIFFKNKKWVWLTATLCLIFLVSSFVWDAGFKERFTRTFLKKDDFYNLGPRTRLWRAQLEIFKEHPLFGVGLNQNERKSKEYIDKLYPHLKDNFYGHAHSNFLQILACMGVFGFLSYLYLWWSVLKFNFLKIRQAITFERAIYIGIFWGLLGFHFQGLTQWNFGDAEVLHNVMFFLALLAC